MANSNLPVPIAMSVKGDLANNWKCFKDQWQNYEITSGLAQKEANVRLVLLKVMIWVRTVTRFYRGYQTLKVKRQ